MDIAFLQPASRARSISPSMPLMPPPPPPLGSVNYKTNQLRRCNARQPVPCGEEAVQAILADLLNPNPAYDSFDIIRSYGSELVPSDSIQTVTTNNTSVVAMSTFGKPLTTFSSPLLNGSDQIAQSQHSANSGGNSNNATSSAPYYYSDLLSEEQQLALQERLAQWGSKSPPPLLSHCNALNNTRYLGLTSLQKCDVGRRVNNIKNEVPNNSVAANDGLCIGESQVKEVNNSLTGSQQIGHASIQCASKFVDAERNKYEEGHTLQKVSIPDKSMTIWDLKRSMTPDITSPNRNWSDQYLRNGEYISMDKRRSKSLEALESEHIYENLGQYSPTTNTTALTSPLHTNPFLNGGINNGINGNYHSDIDGGDNEEEDSSYDSDPLRRNSQEPLYELTQLKCNNNNNNLKNCYVSNCNNDSNNNSSAPLIDRIEKCNGRCNNENDREDVNDDVVENENDRDSDSELGELPTTNLHYRTAFHFYIADGPSVNIKLLSFRNKFLLGIIRQN